MRAILILALISVLADANAQQVYEQVDSEGNPGFSDQPTAGSQAVEIRPNVVDMEEPPAAAPVASHPTAPVAEHESVQEGPVEIDEEPARHIVQPPAENLPGGASSVTGVDTAGGAGSIGGVDDAGGAPSVGGAGSAEGGPHPGSVHRAR